MICLTVLSALAVDVERDAVGPSKETGPGAVPGIFLV